MKITKSQLREIIKEEITEVMSAGDMAIGEQFSSSSADPYSKEKEEQLDEEQLNEIAPLLAALPALLPKLAPMLLQFIAKNPQMVTMLGDMVSKSMSGGAAAGGAAAGGAAARAPAGAAGAME
jgi:hypothetical protein